MNIHEGMGMSSYLEELEVYELVQLSFNHTSRWAAMSCFSSHYSLML